MHFKIETISALPTNISYRKLRLLADRKSGMPAANHPPLVPLRLLAYRDTARSLGYPLAVVSLPQVPWVIRMRVHPRGTRFKSAIVAFFHCERSSRKFIGELLPGKNFPTPHPSTITQLLLERPSASLSDAFLKVSVISRHCNAYRVVIYTTRLWGGLQLSHICHRAGTCC